MDLLRDFWEWVLAVLENWHGYVSGGVLAFGLEISDRLWDWKPSKKIFIGILASGLLWSIFSAWREQYLKNELALTMEINYVGGADPIPGNPGSPVLIWATVANRGAPTVADSWELKIIAPDGRTNAPDDMRIMVFDKPLLVDGRYKIEPSQMLYEQTKIPIPTGGKPKGILGFLVAGFDKQTLQSKGTKYVLTCKNVSGDTIEASRTMTGGPNQGMPIIPGLSMEEIPQQQQVPPQGTKP
jgi:hypothetical protein